MATSTPTLTPPKTSSRFSSKNTLWLLMALAGISVIFSTELPILRDHTGPNHDFFLTLIRDRYLFIPHAIGGVLATFIGPMQFSTRLRRKDLQLHRYLGRVYAYSVFVAGICAVLIEWHRGLFVGTVYQAGLWFLCTLLAIITARNRQLVQHRQWMVRSYAMTFTFIALRVLNVWPAYFNMSDATFTLVDIIVSSAAVILPTIAFNWHELTTKRS